MDLPVRIVTRPPREPVVAVDGALGARGLELSHWPGHRTPPELAHDLSTGAALAFARLPAEERRERTRGATAIVNNHYDTDGTCALFAVRRPPDALPRSERLLAAARCGDFFQVVDERAFQVDCAVGGLADPERSPLRRELAGLDGPARWQRATDHWMEALGPLCDGDVEPYRALWEPDLEALRADRRDLARARRERLAAEDLTVWSGERSSREPSPSPFFDPGRHALFTEGGTDRVLAVGRGPDGWTYRLVVGTLSWFDLVSRARRPRPDLAGLVRGLNELSGTDPGSELAWRAQDASSPSPELWFGGTLDASFAEHNPALHPSALAPAEVLPLVRSALAA